MLSLFINDIANSDFDIPFLEPKLKVPVIFELIIRLEIKSHKVKTCNGLK